MAPNHLVRLYPGLQGCGPIAASCYTSLAMKQFLLVLAAVCLCAAAADKKKQDVQIVEFKAVKREGGLTIDGRLRATGEKPLRRLTLHIDFMDSDKHVLATKQAPIDEDVLYPGDEAALHAVTEHPTHATQYRLRAFCQGDKEVGVANGGPFPVLD